MYKIYRLLKVIRNWDATRKIGLFILFIGFFGGITGYNKLHPGEFNIRMFVEDFYANASTELISIATTVLLIDYLNERREIKRDKKRLIHQIKNQNNLIALQAVEELRFNGWLQDGTLRNAFLDLAQLQNSVLAKADLQNAQLSSANLEGSGLQEANFKSASLSWAKLNKCLCIETNFEDANLIRATFRDSLLTGARLCNADLQYVDFQGADLSRANLRGANLRDSNLQAVTLNSPQIGGVARPEETELEIGMIFNNENIPEEFHAPIFDSTTILPNGKSYDPQKGFGQLKRFTDPESKDFWYSPTPNSPASKSRRERKT